MMESVIRFIDATDDLVFQKAFTTLNALSALNALNTHSIGLTEEQELLQNPRQNPLKNQPGCSNDENKKGFSGPYRGKYQGGQHRGGQHKGGKYQGNKPRKGPRI